MPFQSKVRLCLMTLNGRDNGAWVQEMADESIWMTLNAMLHNMSR